MPFPVRPDGEGNMLVFAPGQTIEKLCKLVHDRLIEGQYTYKTISIKVRLYNFDTYTRSFTLNFFSARNNILIKTSKLLFKEFLGKKIRLIGIRLSNLEESNNQKTINDYMLIDLPINLNKTKSGCKLWQ